MRHPDPGTKARASSKYLESSEKLALVSRIDAAAMDPDAGRADCEASENVAEKRHPGIADGPCPAHFSTMLKLTPLLLALLYGVVMYRFSAWRLARELDARSTELADPGLIGVSRRMADALDLPRLRVHLYEVDQINGLAAPDGRIFLTRGLYRRYLDGAISAEELAGVIAHEMGHVALGHARRRMIDFSGQNALRTAAAMVLSRLLPGVGVLIAGALSGLLAAGLSRSDEFEADEYASALLVKAGIGTRPQKTLFAKLDALTGGAAPRPAWMMSHPRAADRIAAIEAHEARWGITRH